MSDFSLTDLLAQLEANAGKAPPTPAPAAIQGVPEQSADAAPGPVNPPEAAKVLAEQTAPEAAGEPEPPPIVEAPPAPTEKPADVTAAENARPKRRTAAIVQGELDAALARIAELEARPAATPQPGQTAPALDAMTVDELCEALCARGFEPTLRYSGAK